MAEEGEDDYLSDKFLFESASSGKSKPKPTNYVDRRKQAQRESEARNLANRTKSRRVREEEAREEGLRVSLFERARREEEERGARSKAMGMMMRMGFREGEALGAKTAKTPTVDGKDEGEADVAAPASEGERERSREGSVEPQTSKAEPKDGATELLTPIEHRKVPLAVDIWSGM